MKLISNDLRDGDKLPHRHVFNGMGYDGDNISPLRNRWSAFFSRTPVP